MKFLILIILCVFTILVSCYVRDRPQYRCRRLLRLSLNDNDNSLEKRSSVQPSSHETSISESQHNPINSGFLLLNFVAVIWGSQHVIIKEAIDSFPAPSLLNFARFFVSTIVFSPSLFKVLMKYSTTSISSSLILRAGAELGLYTFLGFGFQAIGLETTSATRSAFLLYLNVKFVPILSYIIFQRVYPWNTWISALLAFIGTFLLSTDGAPASPGDGWSILAAMASALFILRIEKFSNQFNAAELNAVSCLTVLGLCFVWVVSDVFSNHIQVNYLVRFLLVNILIR